MDNFQKFAEQALPQLEELKKEDGLDREKSDYFRIRSLRDLSGSYLVAEERYMNAVKPKEGAGWPATDQDIVAYRQTIDDLRKKLEEYGLWTCYTPGEPISVDEFCGLTSVYYDAWKAAMKAKDGAIDDAAEMIQGITKGLKGSAKPDPEHPEINVARERVKKGIEGFVKDVTTAKDGVGKLRVLVDKDAETINALKEKFNPVFYQAEQLSSPSGDGPNVLRMYNELLALCDAFEKDVPAVQKVMDDFSKKYGADSPAMHEKIWKIKGGNWDFKVSPENSYDSLKDGIDKLKGFRVSSAKSLAQQAEQDMSILDNYAEDVQVKTLEECKYNCELAAKFDPSNAEAKTILGKIGEAIKTRSAAIEKAIDGREFPAHMADFAGPCTVDELAKAAEEHLKDTGWETRGLPSTILGVRVWGDWTRGETTILGEYINWRLPVLVAVQFKSDKDDGKDKVRVYQLFFYTSQDKQIPSFYKYGVGGNYDMRRSKFKR